MMSDDDLATVRANQCPVCKNWGFIPGPRGGAGQNIYCANPACRAAFMIAPRHNIQLVERVGEAPEYYYPPQVHILRHGFPLCNFAGSITTDTGPPFHIKAVTPDAWPIGHSWVGVDEFEQSTCKTCRECARS